jgi:hypothetical protein
VKIIEEELIPLARKEGCIESYYWRQNFMWCYCNSTTHS